MNSLLPSLAAVFLVIALGWLAKQSRVLDDAAWRGFEAVTYHLLFPAVIIHTLAFSDIRSADAVGLAGAMIIGILAMAGGLFAMRGLLERAGIEGPAFTSVFQGAVRWNTFVALALASHQFGKPGIALMAIAIAAMIPLINVLCVYTLTRHAQGKELALRGFGATLIRNPFIWSCCVGILLHPVAGWFPVFAVSALDIVGRASLAAGLLVVGAGLDLKSLARPRLPHYLALGLKLCVMRASSSWRRRRWACPVRSWPSR